MQNDKGRYPYIATHVILVPSSHAQIRSYIAIDSNKKSIRCPAWTSQLRNHFSGCIASRFMKFILLTILMDLRAVAFLSLLFSMRPLLHVAGWQNGKNV